MEQKKQSTKIQVTGVEARAEMAQQSFDSWVAAMEADWFEQQRELARIAIERSRAKRRAFSQFLGEQA